MICVHTLLFLLSYTYRSKTATTSWNAAPLSSGCDPSNNNNGFTIHELQRPSSSRRHSLPISAAAATVESSDFSLPRQPIKEVASFPNIDHNHDHNNATGKHISNRNNATNDEEVEAPSKHKNSASASSPQLPKKIEPSALSPAVVDSKNFTQSPNSYNSPCSSNEGKPNSGRRSSAAGSVVDWIDARVLNIPSRLPPKAEASMDLVVLRATISFPASFGVHWYYMRIKWPSASSSMKLPEAKAVSACHETMLEVEWYQPFGININGSPLPLSWQLKKHKLLQAGTNISPDIVFTPAAPSSGKRNQRVVLPVEEFVLTVEYQWGW